MNKFVGVLWLGLLGLAAAQTQEELAQYVARQQTSGLSGYSQLPRRQAYVLPSQTKSVYQQQPKEQVYQIAPKQAYQPQTKYYQPQPQPQPQQQQYYQPQSSPQQYYQPQPQQKKLVRPAGQKEELPEDYDPSPAYQFGFDIKDDEFTNYQKRKEQREGDKISGSYSVVDADGYIRTVTYTADPLEGFKADVVREPTDIKVKFPVPTPAQPQEYQPQYQSLAARKQQTQQYLQAARPQYERQGQTQAYSPSQIAAYAGAQPVQRKPAGVSAFAQQPSAYQYAQ